MGNYQLRIETSDFKKALDMLSTVINKKTALPILSDACIRYNRETKLFTMTAGNTEQWLTIECWRHDEQADKGVRPWLFLDKDDKQEPFDSVCINADAFREAIGTLPAMPATSYLTLNGEGGSLRVVHNKGEFTLPVEAADQYPVVPRVVEKGGAEQQGVSPVVKFSMETSRLLPVISDARCCSANDELRPVMNTVCVDCFHDHMVIVASDGHSLYKKGADTGMGWMRYGEFGATDSAKVLIPTQSMSALTKAFAQVETLTLTADTQRIEIESTDGIYRLTSVLIEGHYPNYESVIPKDLPHQIVVDRQELQATLRRISIFSSEASNLAVMTREDEHIAISASDEGYGRNAAERVAVINSGDTTLPVGTQVGFKIQTMQKLLACIQTDNVIMEIGTPDRAVLLKEDDRLSAMTLLLMPMLVNQ